MRAAARGAGVDAESLEAGLKFLERNAYEAAHGSQELAAKFKEIHLNAREFAKLKPDEQLRVLADKLEGVKDPGQRAAIAMALMGRQGTALLPVLSKGRKGIDELAQKAHEFGTVMDEDLIARSEEYRKVNRELGEAFEGLKLAIVGPLVQASAFKKKLTELIVANRQLIAQAAHRVFRFFADAARGAVAVLKAMATTVDQLIKNTIGWRAAIIGIASAIAVWGVVAAGPWLALAIGVGAVLLALEDIGVWLQGGDSLIGDYAGKLSTIWDPATQKLKLAVQYWKELFQGFFDWLSGHTTGPKTQMQQDLLANQANNVMTMMPGFETLMGWLHGKEGSDYVRGIRQRAATGTYVPPVEFGSAMFTGAAGVEGTTINQTINATPGMDAKQIADEAAQMINDVLTRQNREAAAAHSP